MLGKETSTYSENQVGFKFRAFITSWIYVHVVLFNPVGTFYSACPSSFFSSTSSYPVNNQNHQGTTYHQSHPKILTNHKTKTAIHNNIFYHLMIHTISPPSRLLGEPHYRIFQPDHMPVFFQNCHGQKIKVIIAQI